jgi:hypothetical protein
VVAKPHKQLKKKKKKKKIAPLPIDPSHVYASDDDDIKKTDKENSCCRPINYTKLFGFPRAPPRRSIRVASAIISSFLDGLARPRL